MAVDGLLLYTENRHYHLVDALPYIDTQLGQTEVAQQVKALIDEEMQNFQPRDYLESLPKPELPHLDGNSPTTQEFQRIAIGQPMAGGVDLERYEIKLPEGSAVHDHASWKQMSELVQQQLEYNQVQLTNLELLDRWGKQAWIAHSLLVKRTERLLTNESSEAKARREEVNKKRKLDQISCGNELRRLGHELEAYMQDNSSTSEAVVLLEGKVQQLRDCCAERGVGLTADDRRLPDDDLPEDLKSAVEKRESEKQAEGEPAEKKAKTD